jgi:inosine-uridine nucleoside N-ribohydrolase
VDTDLGGDTDDAFALAMLLGWPDVEITGITTTLDAEGRRAGMTGELLRRAGRDHIPVAVGARTTLAGAVYDPRSDDLRYWGRPIASRPGPVDAALDLLESSIRAGATVLAIGPLTNLALLERRRPGLLADQPVVAMGGWLEPPVEGLPPWGPEMDWNIQCDPRAALLVAESAELTLATLPVAMRAHLRLRDLAALRASGPLGRLLADQSLGNAEDMGIDALAGAHAGLPDDLLNFHWDPVAAATALGWPGAGVADMTIRAQLADGLLRFRRDDAGRDMRVLVDLDTRAFRDVWQETIARAQRRISG